MSIVHKIDALCDGITVVDKIGDIETKKDISIDDLYDILKSWGKPKISVKCRGKKLWRGKIKVGNWIDITKNSSIHHGVVWLESMLNILFTEQKAGEVEVVFKLQLQ